MDVRREFPELKNIVYLNSAAVGLIPLRSREALVNSLKEREYPGEKRMGIRDEREGLTREKIAKLLNASGEEICLVSNTSEGLNIIAQGLDLGEKDNVVIAKHGFPGNAIPWLNLGNKGVSLKIVESDYGENATAKILAAVDRNTKVLAISFVEWIDGFRYDLQMIGDFCRERDIVSVVDSIQGVGAIKLDVQSSQISFLSNGGPKWLLSPNGTGFIFINKDLIPKIDIKYLGYLSISKDAMDFDFDLTLKEDASRFRVGTINDSGIAAMDKSLELILEAGIEKIQKHILGLTNYASEKLASKGYKILGDFKEENRSGILAFGGKEVKKTYEKLIERNIIVSHRKNWIRVSPHFYNTHEDIDRMLEIL